MEESSGIARIYAKLIPNIESLNLTEETRAERVGGVNLNFPIKRIYLSRNSLN